MVCQKEWMEICIDFKGVCSGIRLVKNIWEKEFSYSHVNIVTFLVQCEKKAGIDRGDLEGVDGYFSVLLWDDYRRNKNQKALETVLAYNIQDVVNLETLMVLSYNLKLKDTPLPRATNWDSLSVPKYRFKEIRRRLKESGRKGLFTRCKREQTIFLKFKVK